MKEIYTRILKNTHSTISNWLQYIYTNNCLLFRLTSQNYKEKFHSFHELVSAAL
jgi:hypothetical protein